MKFNINYQVQVVFTAQGLQIWNEARPGYEAKPEELVSIQLWDLFSVFGTHMSMTSPTYFKGNNIHFPAPIAEEWAREAAKELKERLDVSDPYEHELQVEIEVAKVENASDLEFWLGVHKEIAGSKCTTVTDSARLATEALAARKSGR